MNPSLKSNFTMTDKEKQENTLKNIEPEIIENLITIINSFYTELKNLGDENCSDLFLEPKPEDSDKFEPELKHMNQQNKIVDWMQGHNLLENDTVYIEYGAGRAGLSSFVAERLKQNSKKNVKFVIVDRDTRRRKLDKNFRDEFYTVREKMDIADFNLEAFVA
jgi:tRNA:m4X modification enzyme